MGLNLYAALKTSTLLIGMIQPNGVILFVLLLFLEALNLHTLE